MTKTPATVVSAIVAMSENRVIGNNNQLPWRLPADLKHFKALTTGHPIVMGRKTYESIGRPLPNRTNIICTRNENYSAPGCTVVTSVDQAMRACATDTDQVFIIGGAEIYQLFMPVIERIYLTIVHHTFTGDAFFPEIDNQVWREASRTLHDSDSDNAYSYSFITLEKHTL